MRGVGEAVCEKEFGVKSFGVVDQAGGGCGGGVSREEGGAGTGDGTGDGAGETGVVVMGLGWVCGSCCGRHGEVWALACCRDTLHLFCRFDGVGEFGTPGIQDGFEIG